MVGKKLFVAVSIVSAFAASSAYAQVGCDSGHGTSYQISDTVSNGCGTGCQSGCGGQGFGYPGGHGVIGGVGHDLRSKYDKFMADFNLQTARNSVWPQPFKCRDRSLYFQIVQTQVDAGWQNAFTLTDMHFDQDNNELNSAGEAKVAWIMQTAPQHRRNVYVYQSNDDIDLRIASVKSTINRWYSHMGETMVAATTQMPATSDGVYFNEINQRYMEGLPAPVLNASIGGSVSDQ